MLNLHYRQIPPILIALPPRTMPESTQRIPPDSNACQDSLVSQKESPMLRISNQICRRSATFTAALCCLCITLNELRAQFDDPNSDPDALPTVPSGFRISVFAREPLVRQPCSMAFDFQGRLFVGMGPQYRNPTPETPGDSVVLIQDTNSDGTAESGHTFATGFNAIQGLAWKGRDLWVANAPDLTIVRDLDGDDTADEYVRVYTDLGNLEHGLHGLNWAPDGRLYMSKGNSKGLTQPGRIAPKPFRDLWGVTTPPGTPDNPPQETVSAEHYRHAYHDPQDDWGREGGILRCEDGGQQLEIVASGFRNPWDITADSGFNWLGTDNDQTQGDRVLMPFSGAHFGWNHPWSSHWSVAQHPPTAPVSGPLFEGSGTGLIYCDSPQFPEPFRRVFFINDWLRKTTFVWRPDWDGALMKPADGDWTPFVDGGNALYRPTDIEVGPDGALWVLGWSSGYGAEWDAGELTNEGRIFRIEWIGSGTRPVVSGPLKAVSQRSPQELIELFSEQLPTRRIDAREELLRRGDAAVVYLREALNSGKLSESAETWTAWTLGRLNPNTADTDQEFLQWLSGEDEQLRSLNLQIQAIRILADRIHRSQTERALPKTSLKGLRHAEPRLRFATVLAIQEAADKTALTSLLDCLAAETDRTVYYAAWQTLRRLSTHDDLKLLLEDHRPAVQLAAFLALADSGKMTEAMAVPLESSLTMAHLWLEKNRSGSETLLIRGRPLTDPKTPATAAAEEFSESPVSVIRNLQVKSDFAYLSRPNALRPGATVYLDRNYTFRKVPDALMNAEYLQTANNDDGSSGPEFLTFEALVPVTVFVALDTRQQNLPKWLQNNFLLSADRLEADHWTMQLYQKDLPAGTISLGGNTDDGQAGGKGHYSVIIKPRLSSNADSPATLESVLQQLNQSRADRGEVLFRHPDGPGCFKCHSLNQTKNGFGPGLSDIGRRSGARLIAQSIVSPSAIITEGFQLQVIVTTDGKLHSGVLLEESGLSLTLGLSSGERLVIRKDSIEERRTERTSAMPELNSRLRSADVADLTAFLLTRQDTAGMLNATEPANTLPGIQQQADRLILSDSHGLIGEFVFRDEKIRRPYLTRLQTLSGKQVTRNHPPIEGTDATDHDTMHPGIWLGFGDFAGSDFWRNKGTIDHVRLTNMTTTTDGLLTFSAEARLIDEERRELGQITNHLQIKTFDDIRLLVWEAEFYSDTQDLVFGDQEEMGLGARVATAITEKNGGVITNSEGLQTAGKTWGQPADWCDYSGQVDGQHIGITLMSSPTNLRRSWWHNRDYGVFVANPFGRNAMQQGAASRIVIPRGQKFRIGFGAAIHAAGNYSPKTAWQRFLPLLKESPAYRTATENPPAP